MIDAAHDLTNAAHWESFWRRLLREYDAICLAEAEDPARVQRICTTCRQRYALAELYDGMCQACIEAA